MLLDTSNYCFVTEDSESGFQDGRSFSSSEQADSVGSSCSNVQQASAGSSQHGPSTCGKEEC